MKTLALTLGIALLAGAAAAKPPVVQDYARMAELDRYMNEVYAELKAKEDFAKKSFQEQLVLKLRDGAKSWGNVKTLTGEAVVKEIFEKWKTAQQNIPPAEVTQALAQLPEVLKKLYERVPIDKAGRFEASKPLVEALDSDFLHLRQAAIDCLWAIYGERNFYHADLGPADRKKRQASWRTYIKVRK